MEDPFFGSLWDRFPQRTPRRNFYSSHPYAAANVTPTKPEYEYWGAPQLKPKAYTVPVHGPLSHASQNSSSVTKGNSSSKPTPKNVVSIPADATAPKSSSKIRKAAVPRMDEASAATKIQSSFRGFSSRRGAPLKNLRVIRDVKAEAEDIRRRLADRRVVESMLQNEKERLKITEGIMSLLLKLDAIQGVNSFVRESRKLTIRELVNLQELVDVIFAAKPMEGTTSVSAEAAEENKRGSSHRHENKHYTEEISVGTGSNDGGESSEVVASGQPGDFKEIKLMDQELDRIDEEIMRDSLHEDTCTVGASSCEGQTSENQRASEFQRTPCTDDEVIGHFMDEEKCTNNASDCARTCNRLKDLDLSQAEAETIQVDKGKECKDTGEVIEAGAVVRKVASVEEDIVKVRDENEKLKKTVVDLFKETELQNKLINNLRQRVAKLEEQISKSQRKKFGDKKKKKERNQ